MEKIMEVIPVQSHNRVVKTANKYSLVVKNVDPEVKQNRISESVSYLPAVCLWARPFTFLSLSDFMGKKGGL